ncbi:MAG TPA: hypothetical protein VLB44_23075 [Kofleriaceae bacterium]|nr:hypothetical protein [Kofleriaceae bacterium]
MTKEKQLDAGTWGVFFLWIGISFLAHIPWAVWLVGVGVLLLGAQIARKMIDLRVDGFWLVAGALFLLGGISEIAPFGMNIAIIPVLCIIGGIVLLARALTRRGGPRHA